MTSSQHAYEVRPRKDCRGINLISDALPFSRLWYGEPDTVGTAIGFAKFNSRSHDAALLPENDDFEHSRAAPLRSANQRQPGVPYRPRQSFRSLAETIFSRS
jgi:hypothetical protein